MINQATINLVKEFEGLSLKAYPDPATGGEPITVGYGTTAAAGVGIVPKLGMVITEAEAEAYLIKALEKFAAKIRPKITAPITDNEFGAFLSLAYNIGPGAFAKSSALRKFNAGDKAGAADAILLWNKAGGKVMKGLERRRAAERRLFLTSNPVDGSLALDPAVKPAPTRPATAQQAVPPSPTPAKPAKPRTGPALVGGVAFAVVYSAWDTLAGWWQAFVNLF